MIHFVAVSGTPRAVRRARHRLDVALEATRYFDGTAQAAQATSGTWAAAALVAPDPVLAQRMVSDGDALAVINGAVLAGEGSEPFRLDRDLLVPFLADDELPDLDGSFNLVVISPRSGLQAWGDLSGQNPLYYGETHELAVVSNRSSTAARVIGTKDHDLRSLAWLIGHGNLFGDHMPSTGVRHLPPGTRAHVAWAGHRVSLSMSATWVWPSPGPAGGRDRLSDREWDDVTADLVDGITHLQSWSGDIRLSLTGGKDSRLCLALASAAGMTDCMTFTRGPDGREAEVAAEVARVAGFAHEWTGAAVGSVAPLDVDGVWRRLHEHAYRYDGIVSPWDGMNDRLRGTQVDINGFGGELYRQGHAKRFRVRQVSTVDDMIAMFYDYHQPHDPLRVLRPSESHFQQRWMEEWVQRTAKEVRLDALPDKFFVDNRIGHWNGPMAQFKPGLISASTLLSTFAVRKALELAPEVRSTDRFHYEVMRRAAPELVSIPFLGDTWPEAIRETSRFDLPSEPFPVVDVPSIRRPAAYQIRFLRDQEKEIKKLFRVAGRRTDMGSICNLQALRRVDFQAVGLKVPEARTVLSCVSIAITLLGRSERVVDEVVQS